MGTLVIIKNADFSLVAVDTIELGLTAPVISLNSSTKTVTLSNAEDNDMYYTTNGNTPTTSSTKYTTPFNVGNTTVKAICYDGTDSSALPKIESSIITDVEDVVKVAFSTSETGTIKYTTDGSNPTNSSTSYSTPLILTAGVNIKAAIFNNGTMASKVTNIQASA